MSKQIIISSDSTCDLSQELMLVQLQQNPALLALLNGLANANVSG